uniref:Uncharacterized protein n=1 Tax=viral metagenome TaxID=1070528 RepID=A0A6C0CZ18_9ZZZZ
MAKYGELLHTYDPEKDNMYKLFCNYLNNPTMTKIKDVESFSMYMTKTYCMLNNQCRYIIAFVEYDNLAIQSKHQLVDLRWVSLQTRTLDDMHNLPAHSYIPKRGGELAIEINRISKNANNSTYVCPNLPITITLLHTKKNLNGMEYQDKGSVIAAIETYQTIITMNK